MRKNLFLVLLLVLAAGFVGGLVVSGRMSTTTAGAAPAAEGGSQTPAAFPTRATGALPDLAAVAERAVEASVNISSTRYVRVDPWFQLFYGTDPVLPDTSLGSGVVVSPDGYVLTNSHVVGNAGADIRVTLADRRELPARIVGLDELTDLAVIKVDARGLETLPWGNSTELRVAEWVLAVGSPFALSETVTLGIVSAVNRQDPDLVNYSDFIQTDAAINPGNSGGALVNARGELVGINTLIYTRTGGYQGIGFAVPSNVARQVMDELVEHGEIVRGSIGNLTFRNASGECARRARLQGTEGACIQQMYYSDPAYRAGLLPFDVVVEFNGTGITDAAQFQRLVADAPIGSTARIEVIREGRRMSADVPIVRRTPPRRR
jgi:S1-C subfamily serine protease